MKLPLLEAQRDALEKCAYCPKLSRAACPVSNVEANETVTPWGKMSLAYFAMRGDIPADREHGESAWACTGCYGCRERCDHRNPVAAVLHDARAELFQLGAAPPAAQRVAAGFDAHQRAHAAAIEGIDQEDRKAARTVVMLGCSYALHHPDEASAIWRVARAVCDGEIRAVRSCCGLPLHHAGDRSGAKRQAHALLDEVRDAESVVVADPGCAHHLSVTLPQISVAPQVTELLLDRLYANLDRMPALTLAGERLRYHDPCQLGRGLGRYDEPRAVLARLLGAPPAELARHREHAECSGAGSLLPLTRPQTSAAMAAALVREHDAGGGRLVTGCAESLRRFRRSGADVVDLWTLVAEALDQQ